MARIRTPQLRPGMRLKDLRADEFNEAFSAGQHFANMRVGEGLAFKFSPVGGAMLTLTRRDKPQPRQAGLAVKRFALREGRDNTWIASPYSDNTVNREFSDTVEIAKPWHLRRTTTDQKTFFIDVFDGQRKAVRYTFSNGSIRFAAIDNLTIRQHIVPSPVYSQFQFTTLIPGSEIYATKALNTFIDGVDWLDLNWGESRHWAEAFVVDEA